jgi:hypothetical protein
MQVRREEMIDEAVSVSEVSKNCPRCNNNLPIGEFGISRARRDGRNIYCKRCNRERTNTSRQAARERQVKQQGVRNSFDAAARQRLGPDAIEPAVGPGALANVVSKTALCLTPVEQVREAIRTGPKTQKEILEQTKLSKDEIGDALADLLLWTHEVGTQTVGDTRLYFLKAGRGIDAEHDTPSIDSSSFESEVSSFSSLQFFMPGRAHPRDQQKNNVWTAV